MERSNPVRMLCTYRVKDGKEAEFLSLLEKHWPTLRSVGLATDDAARVLRARVSRAKLSSSKCSPGKIQRLRESPIRRRR